MFGSYSKHGVMTDPGVNRQLLDDLPREIGPLCRALQGLLVHVFWAQRYGLSPAEVREDEVQIRPFGGKLARILELDDSPLSVARPPEKRLVCNCRDYSVVLASVSFTRGFPPGPGAVLAAISRAGAMLTTGCASIGKATPEAGCSSMPSLTPCSQMCWR